MPTALDRVLRRRLATQRLTSAPRRDPADVVRALGCVQAQDAPLARSALGLRARADDGAVRAAIDDGRIIRTHILRPTWHFVAPEDLRWILALTSDKVISSFQARQRQLGLDPPTVERAFAACTAALAGTALTRAEVGAALAEHGLPARGEALGHLLGLAELRGLVCSGPLRGPHHTYALVDERVPAAPPLERDDAVRRLVHRFFAGHGPASVADLLRWTTLIQGEIKPALADLDGVLDTIEVDGTTLWFDPAATPRPRRDPPRAFLLHTFDEVFLTYAATSFPRIAEHPRGDRPHRFAEAGGGVVVCDRMEVGWWKRVERAGEVVVNGEVSPALDADQRAAVVDAAEQLAAFIGRPLALRLAGV